MDSWRKKGKAAAGAAIGAAMIAALLYFILVPRPVPAETARARRGIFRETIQADGFLRSKEKHTVTAFAVGDIKRMPLKVGDVVKKGQAITELFWDVRYEPVKAPIDGVISKVYRESAGPIRRGDPIVEIIDPAQLELVAELLTSDAVRLRPGALAEIRNWPGAAEISGKISRISRAGFTKTSALGVEEERTEVIAEFDHLPSEVAHTAGNTYHVDVIFLVKEVKDALLIPVGALFRDGPHWAVYTIENGRAKKRKVEPLGRNPEEASVGAGLSEGETVIVYPGDLVEEGARVKSSPGNI